MLPTDFKDKWLSKFESAGKLFDDGDQDGAELLLAECAAMSPEIWCGLGMESLKDGDCEAALKRFKETLALSKRPATKAVALNNMGSVLADNGQRKLARKCFEESIRIHPEYADSYSNLGLCYKWDGKPKEAIELLRKALELQPHHQQAAFAKALAYLLDGDFKNGWEQYECRWRIKDAKIRKLELPWPEWNGHNAKRVLMYVEQGVGDNIQMMRYAKPMAEQGIECIALTRDNVKSLCEWSGLFSRVYVIGETFEGFDAHIPVMSLPRVLGTTLETIPHTGGYILPPAPSEVIQLGDGLNVGIFWSGATAYRQNIFRSTHLTQWRELLEMDGITWHSMQVGSGEDEAGLFPQVKTYPAPADYLETAKRLSALDMLITIDTGIAHLAGAMGVPVWILIPHGCDFRWLVGREDSPWYASARLFRSPDDFEWAPVFKRIKNELHNLR